MTRPGKITFIFGILVIAIGLLFFLDQMEGGPMQESKMKTYRSGSLGISFEYPADYFLEEKELGNAERRHAQVILTEDTEENRLVREGKAPGREGPISITIDVYQNLEDLSVEDWVKTISFSNYKLSNGEIRKGQLGVFESAAYAWSGLYEADATAVAANGNVYLFTATYIEPADRTRADLERLLSSVRF